MNDVAPGLERVKMRFLAMLQDREQQIAQHNLLTRNAKSEVEVTENLSGSRNILHQISGTAGSLGFAELGSFARDCENAIIYCLEQPEGQSVKERDLVLDAIDGFVEDCRNLIAAHE